MIAVRNLTRRFGQRTVVDAVSLVARDGLITGLLGPNGAGKTTTFRVISGLLSGDSGEIEIDGHPRQASTLSLQGAVPPSLGVLPHVHGLYGRLTVREHIRYFGALRGMAPALLESRISQLMDRLNLTNAAEVQAGTLSEGQRVKVAIAGALIHNPRNIILDEPTSGLDVMSTRALHDLLRSLRDQGACVLFSSHVMHEVGALCDQVVMLANGRVAAAGAPSDLLREHGAASLEDLFVSLMGTPAAAGVTA